MTWGGCGGCGGAGAGVGLSIVRLYIKIRGDTSIAFVGSMFLHAIVEMRWGSGGGKEKGAGAGGGRRVRRGGAGAGVRRRAAGALSEEGALGHGRGGRDGEGTLHGERESGARMGFDALGVQDG